MNLIRLAIIHFLSAVGLKLWPSVDPFFLRHRKFAVITFFFLLIAVMVVFLAGCSTLEPVQVLNPKIYYRHDIEFIVYVGDEFKPMKGKGVMVLPHSPKYRIIFVTPGKIDYLKLTSCHRQFTTEDVPGTWLHAGKRYEFIYEPRPTMEDHDSCMLRVEAYEKGIDNRHSSGYLEFQTPFSSSKKFAKAHISCNGDYYEASGVAICMSWGGDLNKDNGLEQRIKFHKPMKTIVDQDRCKIPEPADHMDYVFRIRNRECTYKFMSFDGKEAFRLQAVGYEEVALRGDR